MAATTEATGINPALALQAEILSRPMTENRRMADVIRALAIDATEAANSGHPGLPMGMADAATVLWSRFHKFDPNATGSCYRPATAPCCSTRCCI